jgi:hypothetical protein
MLRGFFSDGKPRRGGPIRRRSSGTSRGGVGGGWGGGGVTEVMGSGLFCRRGQECGGNMRNGP